MSELFRVYLAGELDTADALAPSCLYLAAPVDALRL